MYVDGIEAVLKQAQPADWHAGSTWYHEAHEHAQRLAGMLGVDTAWGAYAIAALSPRTSWAENLRAAYTIARHVLHGGTLADLDAVPPLRITHVNRAKAWAILTTGDLTALGNGQKTRAFADNILNPTTSQAVTIDSWAYRIAAGMIGKSRVVEETLRGKLYDAVAEAYVTAAADYGLLPLELQAITWVTAHRLEGWPA